MPNDSVTFRCAEEADEGALAQLDRATWSALNSPAPLWSEDAPFFATVPPLDVIVALTGETIAGYVQLRPSSPLMSNAHVLMIGGLAVNPTVQRRGLGEALVHRAVDEARVRRAKLLKLHVLATNLAAMRLYARCGFEVEAVLREEFVLDNHVVDDVIMARRL